MITPLDIENKKFSKQMMNGYSVEEVDEFLDEIGIDYTKKNKELSLLQREWIKTYMTVITTELLARTLLITG